MREKQGGHVFLLVEGMELSKVEDVVGSMCDLANGLGCSAKTNFGNRSLVVHPGDCAEQVVAAHMKRLKSDAEARLVETNRVARNATEEIHRMLAKVADLQRGLQLLLEALGTENGGSDV